MPGMMTPQYNTDSPYWYGLRHASDQPKADGYFGKIPIPGTNTVATEYSLDVDINGKPVQIPSIVPTLTAAELDHVKQVIASEGKLQLTEQVVQKAVDHAIKRMNAGQSPFWAMPEKQVSLPPPGIDSTWEPPLFPDTTR